MPVVTYFGYHSMIIYYDVVQATIPKENTKRYWMLPSRSVLLYPPIGPEGTNMHLLTFS